MIATCSTAAAQASRSSGSITGTVVSSIDRKPLPGANVLLQNTVLGAATDIDGRFHLKGIPPGVYSLACSMIGYSRKVVSHIEVYSRKTTQVVVKLSPLPIQTPPVVVTATNHEQSLLDVPASVSVINEKTIMELNAITVKDALQYVPGVRLLENQVDIRGYTGYSLGVGSRVLLLLDGMPLLTGDTGEIVWEMIPVDEIERIEVVKGASSALYGSSALGGVINIITRGISPAAHTDFRIYSGLYDQPYYPEWRWSDKTRGMEGIELSHSQRIGKFGFLVNGGYGGNDGYRQNDYYHRWNGFAKLEYDLSPFEQLKLTSDILNERQASFYYWENLNNPLLPDPAQENSHINTTRWNTDVSFHGYSGDNFSYTLNGSYFSSYLQYDSAGVPGSTALANTANLQGEGTYDSTGAYRLTFGAALDVDQVVARYYGVHFGLGTAVYLQGEFRLTQPLRLDAGFRYDVQGFAGLPPWRSLSPKLGLVYTLGASTSLRASLARGFRAPSVAELFVDGVTPYLPIVPNTNLQPEDSWSFEIGGTHFFSDNVMLDCALYQSDFSNLIEAQFDSTGGRLRLMFSNVSRARVQGAEVDLDVDLFRRTLRLQFGYNYAWPVDLSTGQVLKFRSRHMLYAAANFSEGAFSIGVNFRYISKMMRLDDILQSFIPNWNSQVPVEVVDARASFNMSDFGIPATLGFHVNNLFQYNYVELPGNLGPIRNFVLSLEGKL